MSTEKLDDVHEEGAVRGYEPQFIDVDGLRTRYYDIGTGDPLVLVHGGNWSGLSSANAWAPTFEHLREQFRIIAFDRLACGMTDNPNDLENPRYRMELDHALAFLDTMDLESVHVAGFSRGGGLATRMVVEEPDRFDSLTITNSATLGPRTGDREHRRDRVFLRWQPEEYEPTDPEYTRYRYTQYSHRLDHITDEYCRTAAYLRSRPKARRTAEVMVDQGKQEDWEETMREQMREAHRRIQNGALTVPTLYVFGRNDLTVPLQMAMSAYDMIAQQNSDVRLKIMNECGHMIFREYPDEFSQTVMDFVDYWS
jgi:2-hydroxy-6-oxo-6-(2'-carboxyphenyl)-hexa-2,4-dienoate hydrolase